MSMLSLVARLGLDSTGFTSGLREAEGAAKGFASKSEGAFAAMGKRLLTGAFFLKIGKEAISASRDIDELSESAERLGITLNTGLKSRAQDFNNFWDSLVVKTRAAGTELAEGLAKPLRVGFEFLQLVGAGFADILTFDAFDFGSKKLKEMFDVEGSSAPTKAYSDLFAKSSARSRERERSSVKEKGFSTMQDYMDALSTGKKGGGDRAQPLDSLASIGGFTRGVDIAQATTQERIAKATERVAYNTESLKGGGF